jgi:ribosomal protein S12 methylthiotransferase
LPADSLIRMKKKRVNVITLGCSKNLVDSEVLLHQLERSHFTVFFDANGYDFDAVVINTCGFIQDAKQESIDMILQYAEAREKGEIRELYVMGCLSERYGRELQQEIPEVDRYFGKFDLKALVEALKAHYSPEVLYQRKLTTPRHYAYFKVAEGCNRSCSFCAIPRMTGSYKSRDMESLDREARHLAKKGVRELLVIAQDLSYYGIDRYGRSRLVELIEGISGIPGIEWIRLHYLYPHRFPLSLLRTIRQNPKVCRYLDLPLQHIADPVLKRMKRHITGKQTRELIARIRDEIPGIALRTTLMVGFPGETKDDFEQLKDFVREVQFDKLGVFTYSHEEGTVAYDRYEDDVPDPIKQERAGEIMALQQPISAALQQKKTGRKMKVLIDRKEGSYTVGRTEYDSPEVDGEVFIASQNKIPVGEFCWVTITEAEDYDLYARPADEEEPVEGNKKP